MTAASPMDEHTGEAIVCETCGCRVETGSGVLSDPVKEMVAATHQGHTMFFEEAS